MEGSRDQPWTLGSSAAYRQQLLYRLLRRNRLEQWLQQALEVAILDAVTEGRSVFGSRLRLAT